MPEEGEPAEQPGEILPGELVLPDSEHGPAF